MLTAGVIAIAPVDGMVNMPFAFAVTLKSKSAAPAAKVTKLSVAVLVICIDADAETVRTLVPDAVAVPTAETSASNGRTLKNALVCVTSAVLSLIHI